MTVATALTMFVIAVLMPLQTDLISLPAFFMIGSMAFMTLLITALMTSKACFRTFCMVFELVTMSMTLSMSGWSRLMSRPKKFPFIDLFILSWPLAALPAPVSYFPRSVPALEPVLPALPRDFSAWSEAVLRSFRSLDEPWAELFNSLRLVSPDLAFSPTLFAD